MRKFFLLPILFGFTALVLFAADPVLWYRHPAQRWGDALPVGKGTIDLHLPENKPLVFQLKLGRRKPLDWVDPVARAHLDRRLN